jgi:hypothetical protein
MEQIDLLFDPVFHEDQNNNELSLKNQYVDSLSKLNMHSSYVAIMSTLWNTGMPCTDLEAANDKSVLKYCAWKGQQVPCEAIFSTFPTDQGMCCTFNMKAADELLYGETYPGVIKDLQNMEKGSSSFNMYGATPLRCDTFSTLFRPPPPCVTFGVIFLPPTSPLPSVT